MSECKTSHFGDVVAAQFSGEEVAILFVPDSGEVIRCGIQDWNTFLQAQSVQTSELAITLNSLGVLVS